MWCGVWWLLRKWKTPRAFRLIIKKWYQKNFTAFSSKNLQMFQLCICCWSAWSLKQQSFNTVWEEAEHPLKKTKEMSKNSKRISNLIISQYFIGNDNPWYTNNTPTLNSYLKLLTSIWIFKHVFLLFVASRFLLILLLFFSHLFPSFF